MQFNAMILQFHLAGKHSQWLTCSLPLKEIPFLVCQHLCIGTDNEQSNTKRNKTNEANSFCAYQPNIIKINSNFIRQHFKTMHLGFFARCLSKFTCFFISNEWNKNEGEEMGLKKYNNTESHVLSICLHSIVMLWMVFFSFGGRAGVATQGERVWQSYLYCECTQQIHKMYANPNKMKHTQIKNQQFQ